MVVREVAPRDGLQAEPVTLPTDAKLRLIQALLRAGVTRLEVTSFVHPKAVPQLADAEAVLAAVPRPAGVRLSALVPNRAGMERALRCRIDEASFFVAASDAFNGRNLRRDTAAALADAAEAAALARGSGVLLSGFVVTAFGCPYQGPVAADAVLRVVEAYAQLGVRSVYLGDTIGVAHPRQVYALARAVADRFPELELGLHLHDTRGRALANVLAGLEAGVRVFDGAVGGLGGCPYAPGASGNVATEDVVDMLAAMGIETGIDLDALVESAALAEELVGRPLPGHVLRARRGPYRGPGEGAPAAAPGSRSACGGDGP